MLLKNVFWTEPYVYASNIWEIQSLSLRWTAVWSLGTDFLNHQHTIQFKSVYMFFLLNVYWILIQSSEFRIGNSGNGNGNSSRREEEENEEKEKEKKGEKNYSIPYSLFYPIFTSIVLLLLSYNNSWRVSLSPV